MYSSQLLYISENDLEVFVEIMSNIRKEYKHCLNITKIV